MSKLSLSPDGLVKQDLSVWPRQAAECKTSFGASCLQIIIVIALILCWEDQGWSLNILFYLIYFGLGLLQVEKLFNSLEDADVAPENVLVLDGRAQFGWLECLLSDNLQRFDWLEGKLGGYPQNVAQVMQLQLFSFQILAQLQRCLG